MSGFDTEQYLSVFLDELEEQIQILDESIVEMEKNIEDKKLIDSIFRAAHTLKGASATMGFRKMTSLTHNLENVLDKIRRNELVMSPKLTDFLLDGLDGIKSIRDIIKDGGDSETADVAKVLAGAEAILSGDCVSAAGERDEGSAAEDGFLDASVMAAVGAAVSEGMHVWYIRALIDSYSSMPAVRAFIFLNTLRQNGEVIKMLPTEEDINAGKSVREIEAVLVTGYDMQDIRELAEAVSEIEEVHISYPDEEAGKSFETSAPIPAESASDSKAAPEKKKPVARAKDAAVRKGSTVRVDVRRLENLVDLVGELVIDRIRLSDIQKKLKETGNNGLEELSFLETISLHIGKITGELQDEIMKARMFPIDQVFNRFPRMIRDVSRATGKEVDFTMEGRETELDKTVIEEIGDPLIHILRNAVSHGIETREKRIACGKDPKGRVFLKAGYEENQIFIVIKDDGRGMDPEAIAAKAVEKGLLSADKAAKMGGKDKIELIFLPGFSTADEVNDISGRGVGMDIVKNCIENINGTVDIHTVPGQGTEFRIRLPLTLAIANAMLVRTFTGKRYAVPVNSITEVVALNRKDLQKANGQDLFVLRDKLIPIIDTDMLLGDADKNVLPDEFEALVLHGTGYSLGAAVERIIGEQEVVIKPLGDYIGRISGIGGATIMGDGQIALIIDANGLVKTYREA